MNRYLFIGSVDFSAHCLETLLESKVNIIDIMSPKQEFALFNSDYNDLSGVAARYSRKVYYFGNINEEENHIKSVKPDVIFVFGLSQIIPKNILRIPSVGCLGSHPSVLPSNRGRHPIVWSLVKGQNKGGVTFFWLDEGVDSGNIWAQKEFEMTTEDDAGSVYARVKEVAAEILEENIPFLENGVVKRMKQDHTKANYLPKRGEKDGKIDWAASSDKIYNLIRALTKPYVGAHSFLGGKRFQVWKARILKQQGEAPASAAGVVIWAKGNEFCVKTNDSFVLIEEHSLEKPPLAGAKLG